MRRNTISGYQGPVAILGADDVLVAQAACRFRAEEDATGADRWQGQLHRIDPPDSVEPGQYRLKFSGGQFGDIALVTAGSGNRVLYFDGIGPRPF